MSGMRGGPSPDAEAGSDGPWRVADTCILGVVGVDPSDRESSGRMERLASRLRGIGFPLSDKAVLVASTDLLQVLSGHSGAPADLLLLDAAMEIDAASVAELRRVAGSDPMIGGVSPRREATAATDRATEHWRHYLPAVTYAPFGDASCLYIKGSVLREFGTAHRRMPVDWDAYAMAINGWGFRMALANRASCRSHLRSGTEPEPLGTRARRLEAAFPGTRAAVSAFMSGTPQAAERLLSGLAPDQTGRRRLAFDLTHVGAKHSGTAEVAVALIRRAAETWTQDWSVAVLASAATYAFHFGDAVAAPTRIDPSDTCVCAAFIRIGQPFSWKEAEAAVRRAPALIFFMLDTIGLDCMRLAPDDLDALWRFTLAEADGLLFNSAFTRRQYERRFGARAAQPRLASLHSLNVVDYAVAPPVAPGDGTLLVIGNAFTHKRVAETARLLAGRCSGRPLAAVGLATGAVKGVECYPSGTLDPQALASLYGRAALVVYPSVYEGFGFPVLEALAHRRPVLVRALPPFAEIAAGVPEAANIHLFHSEEDLVALVAANPPWTEPRSGARVPADGTPTTRGWNDALADLRRILDEAMAGIDHERVLRRIDFMRGRIAWIRHKPFRADEEDDLDRLSALAGRLASRAIRGLFALPGARAMLTRLFRLRRRRAGR